MGASSFFENKWYPSVKSFVSVKAIVTDRTAIASIPSCPLIRDLESYFCSESVVDFVYVSNFNDKHFETVLGLNKFASQIGFVLVEKPFVETLDQLFLLRNLCWGEVSVYEANYFLEHALCKRVLLEIECRQAGKFEAKFLFPALRPDNKRMLKPYGLADDLIGYGIHTLQVLTDFENEDLVTRFDVRSKRGAILLETEAINFLFEFGLSEQYENGIWIEGEDFSMTLQPFYSKPLSGLASFYVNSEHGDSRKIIRRDNQILAFITNAMDRRGLDTCELYSPKLEQRISIMRGVALAR